MADLKWQAVIQKNRALARELGISGDDGWWVLMSFNATIMALCLEHPMDVLNGQNAADPAVSWTA
jgi:hypothetical protein